MMIKKLYFFCSIILFSFICFGCQNLITDCFNENQENQEEIVPFIKLEFDNSCARTVNPVFDITKLTDITLKGTVTDGVEETLFTKKTYAEITDSEFKVQLKKEGTYSFVMTAKLNERNYSSSLSGKEIKCGKNELSFSLAFTNQDENFVAGKGNIQINLKVKNNSNIKYAKVTLLKADGTPAFDEEKIDNSNNGTFTYTKENVTAGNYTVKYSFYNGENLLGYYMETVNVSKDLSSTAIREVEEVAQYYKITYELGDGSWVTDYEPASVYSKFGISALPAWDKAFKVNDGVEGWYFDKNCTEKATNESIKTKTGDITLYAKYAHIAYAEGFGNLVNRIKASSATETEPIKILDKNPDLGKIAGALKDESVKVGIDLSECTELKSLPDSCFNTCCSLAEITIPEGVKDIGVYAFSECSSLKNIIIPEGITVIKNYVFNSCYSLTEITIPKGVTTIGDSSFYNCQALKKITIPDSVTIIGESAFSSCGSLESIEIPKKVTTIGIMAFRECSSLTSIEIPKGVTIISEYAFKFCSSLAEITIPEGVTTIGNEAFANCSSLKEIKIPNSVTSIGYDKYDYLAHKSFICCTNLKKVTAPCRFDGDENFKKCFEDSNPEIEYVYEHSFTGENPTCDCGKEKTGYEEGSCGTDVKFYFVHKTGSLTITGSGIVTKNGTITVDGTSTLSENVFETFADKIKTVTIDDRITGVYENMFTAFISLEKVTAPCTINDSIDFDESKVVLHHRFTNHSDKCICGKETQNKWERTWGSDSIKATYYDKEKTSVFTGSGKLSSYRPTSEDEQAQTYEYNAWTQIKNAETVEICDGITEISLGVFSYWSDLKEVKMSDSVTSIGNSAFKGTPLTKITLSKNLTNVGSGIFSGCDLLENIVIPDGATIICPNMFSGCASVKNIVIPDSVESIGEMAFYGCTSLENIVIPGNVKSIKNGAFSECTKLKTVTIEEGVKTIDYSAFYCCTSLENIVIPDSVTEIYYDIFDDCTNLKTVKIGTGVEYIDNWAFYGCPSTVQITAPEKLKGNKCFNGFNVTWY